MSTMTRYIKIYTRSRRLATCTSFLIKYLASVLNSKFFKTRRFLNVTQNYVDKYVRLTRKRKIHELIFIISFSSFMITQ